MAAGSRDRKETADEDSVFLSRVLHPLCHRSIATLFAVALMGTGVHLVSVGVLKF